MPLWSDGAIVDVLARPRFHREVTPGWLATAATLLGCRPPSLTEPFRYADLGCGTGLDALVVAATFPRAEVWGFDFNPAHIEFARDLAARAELTNVRFVETSFAAMAAMRDDAPPEFDIMVAAMVLNGLSAEDQGHVHALIGRFLRPGGLACLGYACDAGWTGFESPRAAMRMAYEAGTDASDFAIPEILSWLEQVRTGGAALFQRTPALELMLSGLRRRPVGDIAHEFLNREWHALMFADVADAMAEAKCEFLGRATLHENIAAACVPAAMLPLLEEAASIRIRETMHDVAAGTAYRWDIFRRGLAFLPVAEHQARLGAITVAATGTDSPAWPGREPAEPAVYEPLLAALRDGPLSVAAAQKLGALAEEPIETAADAVAMLISSGQAHPVMPAAVIREATPAVARLNDAIIDAIARGEDLPWLISPVLGVAIETNPLEALTIGALSYGHAATDLDGLVEQVGLAMRRGGRSMVRDGLPVLGAAADTMLREAIARVLERRAPLFGALGICRA